MNSLYHFYGAKFWRCHGKLCLIYTTILFLLMGSCKNTNSPNIKPADVRNEIGVYGNQPISYVNDYYDLLSEQEIVALDKVLRDYEKETTREVVLIVVKDIKPYEDILAFGKDMGNRLGVGKKEKNNGLMMILDMGESNVGISTGLGTEKILTDSICQVVINEEIIPKFKKGEFFDGILTGFEALMARWK